MSEERQHLQDDFRKWQAALESQAQGWKKEQEEALEKRLQEVREEAERLITERDGRIAALEKASEEGSAKSDIIARLEKENADLRAENKHHEASIKRANEHIMELNIQLLRARDDQPTRRGNDSFHDVAPSAPPASSSFGVSGLSTETPMASACSSERNPPSSPHSRQATEAMRMNAAFSPARNPGAGFSTQQSQSPAAVTPQASSKEMTPPSAPPREETSSSAQDSYHSMSHHLYSPLEAEPAPEPGSAGPSSIYPELGSSRPSMESMALSQSGELASEERSDRRRSRGSIEEEEREERRKRQEREGKDDDSDDSNIEFDYLPLTPTKRRHTGEHRRPDEPPIPYVRLASGQERPTGTLPAPLTPQAKQSHGENPHGMRSVPASLRVRFRFVGPHHTKMKKLFLFAVIIIH